jgi:thiol-disulfide isomerase/thioredoxin
VLNFWATWCGFCKAEMPYIQQLYEQWPSDELVLLTIAKGEEPATVASFLQENGYSFAVVVDREDKVSKQYGVTGIPCTFFIDEHGVIQFKRVGYFPSYQDIEDVLNQLGW